MKHRGANAQHDHAYPSSTTALCSTRMARAACGTWHGHATLVAYTSMNTLLSLVCVLKEVLAEI